MADDAAMTPRRALPTLAALLATVLLVAGCGGSDSGDSATPATGTVPASAFLAPADATAFITVNTDVGSQAWADAGKLVDLVPGARKAVDQIVADRNGPSWAKDVRPMLGKELVVVVTKDNKPIVLLQPADEAAFERVVRSSDDTVVIGEVDGWRIAAQTRGAIDAYTRALGAGTIESSERFTASMTALPGNAMARAYVSGANVMDTVRELAATANGTQDLAFEGMSMAIVPEKAGLFLSAAVKTPAGGNGTSYTPELLGKVPGDAVVALSFGGTQEAIDGAIDGLRIDEISKGIEEVTGVSLDGILGLFSGEGMLYLREGTPIPEVTLVLAPKDVDGAFRDVDTMIRNLAKGMEAPVKELEQDGVTVFKVDAGTVNVQYGRVDDAVVVTTGASGIRLFRGDGDKLGDAEAFRRAADKVQLGDRTSGFLYVDVDGLVPLVEGLADTADATLPDDVRKSMEAFDSVILQAVSAEGGSTTMSGFVAMNE